MYVQRIAATILFAAFISIARADEVPDAELVKIWLHMDEDFTIENMLPITLIGGEQAYFAHTFFPNRGHCCEDVTVLVRPELEEAREIAVSVKH